MAAKSAQTAMAPPPEVAFYYPGHIWRDSDWVKTLLLFFDGIGLLIPEYKLHEPEVLDPVLAEPLRDKGMLHYLVAEEVVDKHATERMVAPLLELVRTGAFDALAKDGTAFHTISRSRMGFYGDSVLAQELYDALAERSLARPSEDGASIPLHPLFRYLILVLLAQILRAQGKALGLDLWPTTDQPKIVDALTELLDVPTNASAGHVVAFDLQTLTVDLSSVPLDEVLDFRKSNGVLYRNYARSIRKFSRELSRLTPEECQVAFADRQAELDDLASDVRRDSRAAWGRQATFALGLAGASWTYATGDWIGAVLGAGAIVAGELATHSPERDAFSYLFRAHERF